MNEKKSRTLLFILGISIGILIGAGIVFVSMPKAIGTGEVSENRIEQIVNKVYELISSKKNESDSVPNSFVEENGDLPKTAESIPRNEVASSKTNSDSMSNQANYGTNIDTVIADSLALSSPGKQLFNEEIIVKKDELLVSKMVEWTNLDTENEKQHHVADSLLQQLSGIHDNTKFKDANALFQVELWKSPINYRGYRLLTSKLILFGINEEAPLKLFQLGDNVYLKSNDVIYKLEAYPEFKAFERVINPQVLMSLAK